MATVFLKAEWRKLIMANYAIDPEILKPYLPANTELDFFNDTCYVSLVGFMFLNTKVLGLAKVPYHINFEEVNLRFYVRHLAADGEWRRGVVFIKEIVPKAAITFVANALYNEHYHTMPMGHTWEFGEQLKVAYNWEYKGYNNLLEVTAENKPFMAIEGSEAQFITEHYWGYTKVDDKTTTEYQVEHPSWQVYPVTDYNIDIQTGIVYGAAFADLQVATPTSVFLAEGSEIVVRGKS